MPAHPILVYLSESTSTMLNEVKKYSVILRSAMFVRKDVVLMNDPTFPHYLFAGPP